MSGPTPGIEVEGLGFSYPGGAANVARNLASLGARVGLAGAIGEDDAGGEAEAGDEVGCEDFAAEGVGAGLEDGPEAGRGVDGAEGAEGFADGGGVVGEVVDEGDAANYSTDFEAALDAFKVGKGGEDGFLGDALSEG